MEIANCRPFFEARLASLPKLKIILALGRIAHDQTLTTLAKRKALYPFAHGARHELAPNLVLFDSFHCSRYNTNTGRLTTEMFSLRIRVDQTRVAVSDCNNSRACPAGSAIG